MSSHTALNADKVCAVVLAGGRGARMGGVDKGLQPFKGQALAQHAVQRLMAQIGGAPGCIAINANRNADTYAQWGHAVWPDATGDFAGPLAGFLSALQQCPSEFSYLLTVPCDSPLFPLNLLERLAGALAKNQADIAMASAPEQDENGQTTLRAQPVFCLMRTSVLASLATYMASGGRKIDTWIRQQAFVTVSFDQPGDNPAAFANANTLGELHQLEQT